MSVDTRDLLSARDLLRAVLDRATRGRHLRPGVARGRHELEPEWAAYERQVMHDEVNRIRAGQEWAPVPLEAVEAADRSAAGHVDWADKLALRCAELALTEEVNA